MYLSLARKYRPKTFADVAVQSHVTATLRGAIARGRVAHGYLLCGPRGVGKTTLARVLAMALNCERRTPDGEPCGECSSCTRIWSGSASLDVVEIDAASNRGVDDARDLRERAMYAPSTEQHYKVYIVDEAHMLTREAWNALLKILEEPPPRVIFVFATTEPQKIAQAAAPVLSRLQRFDFKRIGPAELRARLSTVLAAEGVQAEAEALGLIARAADGSMRDALSLADQVLSLGDGLLSVDRVREALGLVPEEEYLALLDLIIAGSAAGVFPAVARLVDAGVDLGGFLTGFADLLRAQLAIAVGGEAADVSEQTRAALVERRDRLTSGDLLRMLSALGELEPRFRKSGQQQILVEALLVRFALMDRTLQIEDVLRELGGGGEGRGAAAPRAARAPAPRQELGPPPQESAPPRQESTTPRPASAAPRQPDGGPGGRQIAPPPPDRAVARAADHPVAEPAPPRSAPPRAALEPVSLNRLVERWGDVVDRLKGEGRHVVAALLEHALPAALSARGEVTVEAEDAASADGIGVAVPHVLAAIGGIFSGATRLSVRVAASTGAAAAPRRLTEELVRSERLAKLRKRDPALDAAVEMLDLELMD